MMRLLWSGCGVEVEEKIKVAEVGGDVQDVQVRSTRTWCVVLPTFTCGKFPPSHNFKWL